ncbi:hypothetical protein NDU88_003885 [Pleurodeles waltl]|uniref:Uncharacterized protein n=1 Tax=Pleurodeles waltl TaxID=8319 RepID=A0AAV7RJS0_PLEWA|nr:hypothetical protein NDU88_003885 [Pleurodeles waltl]
MARGPSFVIPANPVEESVQLAHISHQGMMKTKNRLQTKVLFPRMNEKVKAAADLPSSEDRDCTATSDLEVQHVPTNPLTLPGDQGQSGPFHAVPGRQKEDVPEVTRERGEWRSRSGNLGEEDGDEVENGRYSSRDEPAETQPADGAIASSSHTWGKAWPLRYFALLFSVNNGADVECVVANVQVVIC